MIKYEYMSVSIIAVEIFHVCLLTKCTGFHTELIKINFPASVILSKLGSELFVRLPRGVCESIGLRGGGGL